MTDPKNMFLERFSNPLRVIMDAQVSSTAGFRTQPNTPERRGFASPLPPHSGPGDKALKDALAAAEAKLKASEASKADGQRLQEKVWV